MLTIVVFLVFSVVWEAVLNVTEKDTKLLEALGTNETTVLLVLSALLTTVIAPICEETLFRGYIFGALSKWRGWLPAAVMTGILFGGVHFGSAPVEDLVPLGVLGFALCLLYRRTGSLYPCIALHSLNNSFAFGELERWGWWIPAVDGRRAGGDLDDCPDLPADRRDLRGCSRRLPSCRARTISGDEALANTRIASAHLALARPVRCLCMSAGWCPGLAAAAGKRHTPVLTRLAARLLRTLWPTA